ncbi:MAG: methanogenesis marker 9 domain-containing protein [Halobacteriota archaeon]|nr:methanogenesis marker 9 domain-containing protein [Halobacteriota archaeon]
MFDPELIRAVPGWKDAPVPLCHGGDPRALTFCCDPRYALTHEERCSVIRTLDDIGLSKEEYIKIKEEFTEEMGWSNDRTCFGSLVFCCLRSKGCYRRDPEVSRLCEDFEDYYKKKRVLALRILKSARNRELVEPYIKHEEDALEV